MSVGYPISANYAGDTLSEVTMSASSNIVPTISPSVPTTSSSGADHHYLERGNPSIVALGNLKRVYMWPFRGPWYISPDICAWGFPTAITLGLLAGTLYLTGEQHSMFGTFVLVSLVVCALGLSLLVCVTDPGVYPRLAQGERDPLEHAVSLPMCKICAIRRPPRAAHCYNCGVCVLEHDHHCGVIGGCVGQRSLRFFTFYLLSIGSACSLGLWWIATSLFYPPITSDRPPALDVMSQRRSRNNQASLSTAGHIFLMIFVGNIALLVGGMGLYYVYLMLTDTTRREVQGKIKTTHRRGGIFSSVRKAFFEVPPSMLERHSPCLHSEGDVPLVMCVSAGNDGVERFAV